MLTQQLQLGLLVLALGVNVLMAYGFYRLERRRRAAGGRGSTADAADGPDDAVACPACGVENDRDYRFCRSCVSELPVSTEFDPTDGDPLRQIT